MKDTLCRQNSVVMFLACVSPASLLGGSAGKNCWKTLAYESGLTTDCRGNGLATHYPAG
jgi:hypothetical protein